MLSAGKDYADARLTDLKSTLVAMAGSDPDLREVVSNAIQINQEVSVSVNSTLLACLLL